MSASRYLVIRFSSIGDIVLTSPLIRCLKQQKNATIHVLTKPQYASLLEYNPYVDRIIPLRESFGDTIRELKAYDYDKIIDLHKNLRSYRVRFMLGLETYSFPKYNLRKWLHVRFKWNVLPEEVHIVDRMFRAVEPLQVENDGRGLDFFLPPEKDFHRDINRRLQTEFPVWKQSPIPFAVFAIGGAHATKCLPPDFISEVCSRISMPVILLGGPSDQLAGEEILNTSSGQVFNACGKLNLVESAAVLRLSDVVLSHDTGMMHIAAAFQKPIVSIWGNTVPAFGMYPYYGDVASKEVRIEQLDLSCRPCSKIGYDQCPKGHFKCMRDHSPERIAKIAIHIHSK